MKICLLNFLLIFLFVFIKTCENADKKHSILFTIPTATKSHYIFYTGIINALAKAGHKVTVLSPITNAQKTKNVEQFKLQGNLFNELAKNSFQLKMWSVWQNITYMMPKTCVDSMKEKGVSELLAKKYDLVAMPFNLANCYLPYVYQKQIPFIYIYPNKLHSHLHEIIGNLDTPSISPHLFLPFYWKMTFLQRTVSALFSLWDSVYNDLLFSMPLMERECIKESVYGYSAASPSLSTIQRNASLAIINNVRSLESPPKPHSLKVVHAGGIHIEPRRELSLDMQKWLNDSGEEGFILFSLGSVITPSEMESEEVQTLIRVFQSLKVKVLWKFNLPQIENLPSNVKITKWVPQQDVLSHPKIRLFITHGGLLSSQEATYFSVPMIGLPIFGDQHQNMLFAEVEGWAKVLPWEELDEKKLRDLIENVLTNTSLQETTRKRSKLMRDAPSSPEQDVVFWVNYILRHKGASHLNSPLANLPWYKIYNTDVWVSLVMITVVTSLLPIMLLSYYCRKRGARKSKLE